MSQVKNLVDAIDTFIVGCKADGIWDPIKACCVMAAWDGLNGALIPLKGDAPTNFNFVSGDYNRKTGLVGDGSTKYLNSNRNNNADPQNSNHNAAYITSTGTGGLINSGFVTTTNNIYDIGNIVYFRNRASNFYPASVTNVTGFVGHSRSNSSNYNVRIVGANTTVTEASLTPVSDNVVLYQRNNAVFSTHRISFYSIGEAIDLAALDTRVSNLMTAIGAAIP